MQVWSLGWEDPQEKGMATHSSILAWRIPWTEEPGKPQSMVLQKVRSDYVTSTSFHFMFLLWASLVVLVVKNLSANARDIRDAGLIPGLGRSTGRGHGNPLQCSCLENPRDEGAWWAAVYGVAQSWTRLKWLSSIGIVANELQRIRNYIATS